MPSRRTSGGQTHLAVAVALLGALTLLAAPAQALPGAHSPAAGPLAGLVHWLHDLLGGLSWAPAEAEPAPAEPRPAWLPEGSCMDPNGNKVACDESEEGSLDVVFPVETDLEK